LYVDLLDTTGTLVAMSKQAGLFDARDGDFEGSSVAFLVDSACISMSGLFFGSSPCTPFVGEFRRPNFYPLATTSY
jgi:AGZA family xanthine/uracil permease-like MFS transporter